MEIKPGVYKNIPNETYHYGDGWKDIVGSSGIKKLLISPLHFKAWQAEPPKPPTDAMNFGGLYHLAVLERKLFLERTAAIPPDVLSKSGSRAGNAWYEWKAAQDAAGKLIFTTKEAETLTVMVEAVDAFETARAILNNPACFETSIVWDDLNTGIRLKCRLDFDIENLGVIVDLKSCESAAPWIFPKHAANMGYDIQAAHYLNGARTKGDYVDFVFLAQEKTPPYAVGVYRANQVMMDNGRTKIKKALDTLKRCRETDRWPGYPDEVMDISLPKWALVDPSNI